MNITLYYIHLLLTAPHDVTILIISQGDSFNGHNAQKLKNQILAEANTVTAHIRECTIISIIYVENVKLNQITAFQLSD